MACDGSLWSHEVDALKMLDFANDTVVAKCKTEADLWISSYKDNNPTAWKGCWERAMEPSCGVSGSGTCVLKAMTYDPKRDEIYYAFRPPSNRTESISRFSRTAGSKGVGADEVIYSGIYYELRGRRKHKKTIEDDLFLRKL